MAATAERVIVKDADGKLLIRWMIGHNSRVAYITTEDGAKRVDLGFEAGAVIGFPVADVFFDAQLVGSHSGGLKKRFPDKG